MISTTTIIVARIIIFKRNRYRYFKAINSSLNIIISVFKTHTTGEEFITVGKTHTAGEEFITVGKPLTTCKRYSKLIYGQEPPSGESTCVVNYQLLAVIY